jgi:hypothetical protein
MLLVNHQITIGSTTYTPKNRSHLIDLQAIATLAVPVNHCRIGLGQPQALKIAANDPVAVKLGYGNDAVLVFTGIVESVEWGIDRVTVYAVGGFQSLTSARFNLLYEQPNAGDIVKDIAQSRLKLAVATIENGLKFPVYALGNQISAYDHLNALSQQCGFDLYANSQDKLVFAKYKAANTHDLAYGSQILKIQFEQPVAGITGVEVYGESPSSQGQGEQAYAWLTKKEVKGSAGSGSGILVQVEDPTARTEAIAADIAQATLARRQQKQRGQIKILGNPTMQLGDAITVKKMPLSQQNGTFKIVGVTHRLNHQQGFYTVINWEEA